ncbi:MAG: 3-keto-disaccharide hydrolase [Planctomycetaceae bacterium]
MSAARPIWHRQPWFGAAFVVATMLPFVAMAAEEGFTPLFDGKTLEGWEGDTSLWKVVDGVIVGESPGIKQNQFLATTRSYADFELRLEFRVSGADVNSGVQFRSQRLPKTSAKSHEMSGYQADIGQDFWGSLYDESRRNRILAKAKPEITNVVMLAQGDWNRYVIRAEGSRITLTLNGFKSVEFDEEEYVPQTGLIALQVHAGPPCKCEFRNIRIKELKPGN